MILIGSCVASSPIVCLTALVLKLANVFQSANVSLISLQAKPRRWVVWHWTLCSIDVMSSARVIHTNSGKIVLISSVLSKCKWQRFFRLEMRHFKRCRREALSVIQLHVWCFKKALGRCLSHLIGKLDVNIRIEALRKLLFVDQLIRIIYLVSCVGSVWDGRYFFIFNAWYMYFSWGKHISKSVY